MTVGDERKARGGHELVTTRGAHVFDRPLAVVSERAQGFYKAASAES
jgi:hypothetical protein